ncbi:MAG: glycogen/starch synthase, partial [Clostridia bacterium]|nr:glycogen/starch synthase [Clostridia bacterium]
MKKSVLFVGAEAMPFAATGGLGDVLGSLPTALAAEGADVRVVMPLYSAVGAQWREQMTTEAVFTVELAWRRQYCGILSLKKDGVTYYFVDNEYYFDRAGGLYGHYDDGERFAFFCTAVLEMLPRINFFPKVLHANDWQSALSLIYLCRKYMGRPQYAAIRRVFTIHNIEYQGKYDFYILGDVFGLGAADRECVEYDGCINLMKGAIESAEIVSTVNPRYAEEIMTPQYSHGLWRILQRNSSKVCGILNGIDYAYYDPEQTPSFPRITAQKLPRRRRLAAQSCAKISDFPTRTFRLSPLSRALHRIRDLTSLPSACAAFFGTRAHSSLCLDAVKASMRTFSAHLRLNSRIKYAHSSPTTEIC